MPDNPLQFDRPTLASVRGIVLGANRRGDVVDLAALRQWLRLNAEKFHAQKVDLWAPEVDPARIVPLLAEAAHLDLRLSLRTMAPCATDALAVLRDGGLFDVLFCPATPAVGPLRAWADACGALALPLRVQLPIGALSAPAPPEFIEALGGAAVLTLHLDEPLLPAAFTPKGPYSTACLDHALALAEAVAERETDVYLMDLPFCHVPERLWGAVTNGPQRLAGHQHYLPAARDFAAKMAPLPPHRLHQAVEIALGEGVSFHSLVDHTVLPWILEKPRWFFWLWFAHKLTRRLPRRRRTPAPLPEGITHLEAALADYEAENRRTLGPECAACALHRICDHRSEAFRTAFPGLPAIPAPGEAHIDPLAFRHAATTWFDALDTARRALPEHTASLAHEARRIVLDEAHAREIPAESYAIENHATHRMPASVRWFSFSTTELQSTVLARLSPPFTLAATFGGGFADQIGFRFGRHARIVCPMTAGSHKLTLHVDANGHYVLLRDGQPVIPTAFRDGGPPPERLGSVLEPRLAIVNIDGQIVTQTVQLWEHGAEIEHPPARHSAIIVCTRFARRLEAVLLALAHQDGLAPGDLEVVVGYVPGIDATDDVIESLGAVHPALRIVRVPFGPEKARAKGFLINECAALATGAWITLLDADILLPPDYFRRLDALPDAAHFAAPDGRHMLTPEATARVLLGEIRPWDSYNALREQAVEYRHRESDGVPPGFCQSFRRAVFAAVRYEELDHFEGSDWWFSKRVMEQFGPETRLEGLGVLHLDHGGSQWYGTGKQR